MQISIVATLFYSEPYLREFHARMADTVKKITPDYEIIFVNDGSPDKAREVALELQQADPRVTLIDLSKNFGHHRAIMTGLEYSSGDYVFLIDTDLEEDPELLTVFWEKMQEDQRTDVIYGVQEKRKGRFFERVSGKLHYKLFYYIAGFRYPSDTLTSRVMTRKYVDGLKTFTEKEMDVWGLFILNGFNQKSIVVHKKSKGTSTYTIMRKLRVAINSITSLTTRPLYFIFFLGGLLTLSSLVCCLYLLFNRWVNDVVVLPVTQLLASVWLLGGLIILMIGIVGIYLSKVFFEVKKRPLTIVKHIYKSNTTP